MAGWEDTWKKHPYGLLMSALGSILAVIILAAAGAGWARYKGADDAATKPSDPTALGAPASPEPDFAGWSDSSGHRSAIPFRDENTPWADQVSFNRLSSTPSYGDERPFFDVRDAQHTEAGSFSTDMHVTVGQQLIVRAYIHNCADPAVNQSPGGRGDAVDARLHITVPSTASTHHKLYAYIVADNADPQWVADGLDLRSDTPFKVRFVPGTGRLLTNAIPNGMTLDDRVASDDEWDPHGPAALLGYDKLDGRIPAQGFKTTAIAIATVEVVAA